jgi:NADPH:quinone reductase-like Zn-dependent oxidoreductase
LYRKPSNISHNEAAAIPHASILALQGFVDYGKVKAGQSILINGAGGGVGTLGIQFLKQFDVKVTGVDSAEKLDLMRSLGFDSVMDYKKVDFTATGETYDMILDAKSNRSVFKYARALKKGGRYVTVGGSMIRLLEIALIGSLISLFTSKKLSVLNLQPNEGLDHISELVEKGQVKPVIDGPYEFEKIPELIQYFGEGEHLGKIVVEMDKQRSEDRSN